MGKGFFGTEWDGVFCYFFPNEFSPIFHQYFFKENGAFLLKSSFLVICSLKFLFFLFIRLAIFSLGKKQTHLLFFIFGWVSFTGFLGYFFLAGGRGALTVACGPLFFFKKTQPPPNFFWGFLFCPPIYHGSPNAFWGNSGRVRGGPPPFARQGDKYLHFSNGVAGTCIFGAKREGGGGRGF